MSEPLCRHCRRPKGGRGHEPRDEGDTIHVYEPQDWADQLVAKYADWIAEEVADGPFADAAAKAIERAVREALTKAAEVAENLEHDYDPTGRATEKIVLAIRALGAAK